MKNFKFADAFHAYLTIFMAAFCCLPKIMPVIIFLFLPVLIYGFYKSHLEWKWYPINILLVVFYALYLIGIFFTNNTNMALGYAENKMSFLLFPLLFSFQPKFDLKIEPVILGLNSGILIAGLIGLINVFGDVANHGFSWSTISSVHVSPIHHPSYLAIFILVSVIATWYLKRNGSYLFTSNWVIPYSVLAIVFFLLCFSLAGILFAMILFAIFALVWIKKS